MKKLLIINALVALFPLHGTAAVWAEWVAEDEAIGVGFGGDGWDSRRPSQHDDWGAANGASVEAIADLDAQNFTQSTRAVRFDGVNDELQINSFDNQYHGVDRSDKVWIDMWISPDSFTGGRQMIFESGGTAIGSGIVLINGNLYLGTNDSQTGVTNRTDPLDLTTFTAFGYSPSNDYLKITATFYNGLQNRIELSAEDRFGNSISTQRVMGNNLNDWTGGDAARFGRINGPFGGNRSNNLTNLEGGGTYNAFAGTLARFEYQSRTIPEPSTIGMLALGVFGVRIARRKKIEAKETEASRELPNDIFHS